TLATLVDDARPTWTLATGGQAVRQQRREAFRLEVSISARLGTSGTPAAIARIHDLSEGGLRCTPPSGVDLPEGAAVWVDLPLPDGSLRVDGTVVRVQDSGQVGVAFVGATEADTEKIRGFLFAEQ